VHTEIAKGVYWVGVVDWGLRHFHGHELSTQRGSTYNAYLIVDEKVVLVDTVWEPFRQQLLENIREVIDPARIDYIVASHAEADHSGGLRAVKAHAPQATIIVSKLGAESIEGHYHQGWDMRVVRTGDRLPIGERELLFVESPLLHWPDSLFTYVSGSNVLMPNDAFGQHYASAFRFNDQVDRDELYYEALKYYANILTPYSAQVTRKIDELLALNLPIDVIAPSHGVVWRDEPLQIVRAYQEWAAQVPEARAVILYDTMWNATRRMALAVGEGLAQEGIPYRVFHMAVSDRNEALTEVFRSQAVLIGSPTLNRGLLPTITPILEDLRGLGFKNKIGAAFGSYGWSGESTQHIEDHLARSHVEQVAPGVSAKWQPRRDDLERCRELGRTVAQAIRDRQPSAQ
jgi:anaerobic nitric oxide reductase flavorubredoxin